MSADPRRLISRWLFAWCALLLGLVVIGGVTRLTESGLSITEWRPVTGILPPLTTEAWEVEFAKYRQIPEYTQLNVGMTLAEFQRIFFWEYLHRVWARLLGLALALPFAWFLWRGQVRGKLAWRIGTLIALVGAQGALGWFMVASGLVDRVDVSQYRLAAHLGLALFIYALAFWTALDLHESAPAADPKLRRWVVGYAGLVAVTILAGAFVAGLDAGRGWNTFPLMGGSFVPAGYGQFSPWWRDTFENPAAVQFHHRWLGVLAALGAVGVLALVRRAPGTTPTQRRRALWLAGMAGLQALLGVTTLVLGVPVPVAAVHQGGAVILLTLTLTLLHALGPSGLTQRGDPHSFPEARPDPKA